MSDSESFSEAIESYSSSSSDFFSDDDDDDTPKKKKSSPKSVPSTKKSTKTTTSTTPKKTVNPPPPAKTKVVNTPPQSKPKAKPVKTEESHPTVANNVHRSPLTHSSHISSNSGQPSHFMTPPRRVGLSKSDRPPPLHPH